jgi:HAMP domain-containing protein
VQSKIIFLVIAIMAVTAILIITISGKEINHAMLAQQERLSRHVLSLINLNIRGEYNNLITDKIDSVTRYKQILKARTDLVVKLIEQQHRYSRENRSSMDTAQQMVLDWVVGTVVNIEEIEVEAQKKLSKIVETLGETFADIRIGRTGIAFLFDNAFSVLAMTDPDLASQFKQTVNFQTGNLLVQDMVTRAIQGGGFLSYQSDLFEKQEMIAYIRFFKPLGWYIGVTVPVSEIRAPAKEIVFKQSALIGMILLCSLLSAAWMVSRISRPLKFLADRVKAFSSADLIRDETQDMYLDQLAKKNRDEVGLLANAFVFMKGQLKENIRQLLETTAKNERIQGELNIAKDIQLGLLPKIFPPFPDCKAMDIFASLEPAKEVGGLCVLGNLIFWIFFKPES